MIFVCFPKADGVRLVALTTSWPDPVFGSRNGSGLLGPLATSLALTMSRMRVSTSAEVKGEDSLVGVRQVIRLGGRSSSSFDFFLRSLWPRKGVVLRWERCDSQAPSQGQCAAASRGLASLANLATLGKVWGRARTGRPRDGAPAVHRSEDWARRARNRDS